MTKIEYIRPQDIEKESFRLIGEELERKGLAVPEEFAHIIYRVIHTTADFEYADTMTFSEGVLEKARAVLYAAPTVITDTNMALAGINKSALSSLGGRAVCFMADPDVAEEAKERGITRAAVSMQKAMKLPGPKIFAIGNAPTALLRIYDAVMEEGFAPDLVIGVPVGFVNVAASKERILACGVPCIVNRGRKGGSNVAAAIVNALLYAERRRP